MAKRALIIANEEYDDPRFPDLPGASADADGLGAVLADPAIGDFDVTVLRDGRDGDIRVAVAELFSTATRDDTVLLHISAHGRKDARGRLHFVASNTRLQYLVATSVSAEYINQQIDDSLCQRVVLLLDCCYSGAFTRGFRTRGEERVDVAEPFNGRGRVVITASTALQFSHELEASSRAAAQPSVFTQAAILGLRSGAADVDADGYVSAEDLFTYIHDEVRRTVATQTPTRSADRMEGTVYLARNPAHVRSAAAEDGVPADVRAAVTGPHVWQRMGALHELGRLLESPSHTTQQAALHLVRVLAAQDDPDVARAAGRLLINKGSAEQTPPGDVPPPPHPSRPSGSGAPTVPQKKEPSSGDIEGLARKVTPRTIVPLKAGKTLSANQFGQLLAYLIAIRPFGEVVDIAYALTEAGARDDAIWLLMSLSQSSLHWDEVARRIIQLRTRGRRDYYVVWVEGLRRCSIRKSLTDRLTAAGADVESRLINSEGAIS